MRDTVRLAQAFLRNPRNIGTLFPSSAVLARRMVEGLPLSSHGAVLELGPGTGPLTRALCDKLADPSRYLGVDINAEFVGLLKRKFPQFRFVCGSAHQAQEHLSAHGHDEVRAIISGLPFASLPEPVQNEIMDGLSCLLKPGVEFRTFQYVHALRLPAARRFRREMTRRFGRPAVSKPVLWNIPPAVVMTWRG